MTYLISELQEGGHDFYAAQWNLWSGVDPGSNISIVLHRNCKKKPRSQIKTMLMDFISTFKRESLMRLVADNRWTL